MKKVTIGICLCLFIILLILIASLQILHRICRRLPNNLVPFAIVPMLIVAALIVRTYDNIDGIMVYEHGRTSYVSYCSQDLTSGLPNLFVALALYINLFLWINFVLASAYDAQQKHPQYMRVRRALFALFGLCAVLLVTVPVIVLSLLECEGLLDRGLIMFVAITFSLFAVIVPAIGAGLLLLLRRHFNAFYLTIRTNTAILLVCQGAAFFVRAAFNLLRLKINCEFLDWYATSVRENDWGAPGYLIGQLITECVPIAALIFSIDFAVDEKILALQFAEEVRQEVGDDSETYSSVNIKERATAQWTDYRRHLEEFLCEANILL